MAESPQPSLLRRFVYGGLVLSAAAVLSLGLYGHHAETFHHNTARFLTEISTAKGIQVTFRDSKGLSVHGVLIPRAGSSLSFDGRITYDLAGSQYNFTLVNDHAYVTVEDLQTGKLKRNACIHPENVPPISTLTDALKNSRVVDAAGDDRVKCLTHKMVEFDFAGETYVMCAGNPAHHAGESPGSVMVFGDDLQASLTLLSDSSEGVPSAASLEPPPGLDLSTCDRVTSTTGDSSLVTGVAETTARVLQRTQDAFQIATGGRRLSKMASDCSCKDGLKKCLFVHGLGLSAGTVTDKFTEYFGTIEKDAKCCSSFKFLHIDTLNSPWYADASSDALCTEAANMAGAKDKMAIEGVAVIAHSMGNLVFQNALMKKKCALAKSSKYIALNAPMYGSMSATTGLSMFKSLAVETATKLCTRDPSSKVNNPLLNALLFVGLCPTRVSLSSMVFKGSNESTPELNALLTAAGEQYGKSVTSSLCGVSPTGLASAESLTIAVVSSMSGHGSSENDGQVTFDSCRATLSKSLYSTSWSGGKHYKASINHLDGTFRYGDGWWGDDRKPIKWFNCQF